MEHKEATEGAEHKEPIEGAEHAEHIECMKTIEVMGDLLVCLGTVGNFVGICLKSWGCRASFWYGEFCCSRVFSIEMCSKR